MNDDFRTLAIESVYCDLRERCPVCKRWVSDYDTASPVLECYIGWRGKREHGCVDITANPFYQCVFAEAETP